MVSALVSHVGDWRRLKDDDDDDDDADDDDADDDDDDVDDFFRYSEIYVFDSSTKIPEGITTGQTIHLGNFDNCIGIDLPVFTGKYCLASVGVDKTRPSLQYHVSSRMRGLPLDFRGKKTSSKMDESLTVLDKLTMEIAVCVPSSCAAQDIEIFLNAILEEVGFQATVSEEDCQTNLSKELRLVDWITIAVIVIFLLLIILSTTYDAITPQGRRSELLLAFSAISNGRRILATSSSSDTMGVVNGVRVISLAWVVLAHRHSNSVTVPYLNLVDGIDFLEDWKRLYLTNGTLSVDTFLMLSGMLLAYVFLKEVNKTGAFNVPMFYIHRYIRLTPLLAAVILFHATLLQYMGSGPLWERLIKFQRDSCESNWWPDLLYVQNYVNNREMCVGHSWYLAVDMHLYILSPLILIPLWKRPKLGCGLICLLILIGWAIVFSVVYIKELYPVIYPMLDSAVMLRATEGYYIPTHGRFMPWLIGVGLGFILHSVKNTDTKPKLTKIHLVVGWSLSVAFMLLALFLAAPFMKMNWKYSVLEAAFYCSLHRPVWALGVAWIVFACASGYGGPVNTLLSWKVFQPLSRVSYAIYLIHFPIQLILISGARTSRYFNESVLVSEFFGDFVIATIVGFVLTLAFESPFIIIEKVLCRRRK
ncbi:nose resistant to fluoxetine protein 6 [Anabrus simplex]|uniref:nose resistant to fluoxetine protein 6 n=1 Tax=Anabrus simplex TaxID=316456 RepID=UPI0035A339F1